MQAVLYLWALAVLQDLFVSVFAGEEASASSVQVLQHKQKEEISENPQRTKLNPIQLY